MNGIRNFVMGRVMRREVGKGGVRKVLSGVQRALPSLVSLLGAAAVLIAAAIAASLMPAARASRVDVLQALRSE